MRLQISKKASMYATEIVKRDSQANTVGEAREEYTKLIEDNLHQFSILPKVETYKQVNQRSNYFSEVDGGYPRGMSTCYVVGLSGDCGFSCPDFQSGICKNGQEMLREKENIQDLEDYTEEELNELMDLYGLLE